MAGSPVGLAAPGRGGEEAAAGLGVWTYTAPPEPISIGPGRASQLGPRPRGVAGPETRSRDELLPRKRVDGGRGASVWSLV